MTTAHRPTWKAAYGLSDNVNKGYVPTRSYSARDLPGYLKLKERQWGQGSVQQLRQKDFKAQLLKRQTQALKLKNGQIEVINAHQIEDDIDGYKRKADQDANIDFIIHHDPGQRKLIRKPQNNLNEQYEYNRYEQQDNPFPEDADSEQFMKDLQDQERVHKKRIQSDQDQSDEENSEQLLRQYQKIKEQRQKEQLLKRQQKHKYSMANKQSELLKGNPLIDSSYALSKRWYEDTVFRNQAKKVQQKKTFVNDYVRSDFHRKFMNRYVMR